MGKARKKAATLARKGSFRDLPPLEQGGRVARDGFDYQDHVAAGKCLDMLLGGGPAEVWCEAEDDIVLVWLDGGQELFEFVQVKGNDLGQAWTVAELCRREAVKSGGGPGRCIVEKSLAHDRADEKCRFRVVSRWNPDCVLSPLRAEFCSEARTANLAGIKAAGDSIAAKLGECKSPNGNGLDFWAKNAVWELRATTDDVRNANLLKLERLLETGGQILTYEQREQLYLRLFLRVQDASLACGRAQRDAKRLKRADLSAWIQKQMNAILHPVSAGTSANLMRKFTAAQVPASSVEAAQEQRRRYLQEVRTTKYLCLEGREDVEAQALARLHRLKTQLDAGELSDNGSQFLSRCQQALLDLRAPLSANPQPSDWLMFGYLYDVMNRCQHELVRSSV